jgi:hypothetical protein
MRADLFDWRSSRRNAELAAARALDRRARAHDSRAALLRRRGALEAAVAEESLATVARDAARDMRGAFPAE